MISIKLKSEKRRNFVAKDLLTPKYRMRVAQSKKRYNRQLQKSLTTKELYAA